MKSLAQKLLDFEKGHSYRCHSDRCSGRDHTYVDEVLSSDISSTYYLHGNLIAMLVRDNGELKLKLWHSNWHTQLTADRLNRILNEVEYRYGIALRICMRMYIERKHPGYSYVDYLYYVHDGKSYQFKNPIIINLTKGTVDHNGNPEILPYAREVKVGRKRFADFGDYKVFKYYVYRSHEDKVTLLYILVNGEGKVFYRFKDMRSWLELKGPENLLDDLREDRLFNAEARTFIKTLIA